MIGHEADAYQIFFDTGASLYAIHANLAELTNKGILVQRTLRAGRVRSTRYRLNSEWFSEYGARPILTFKKFFGER
jgi:hypothetical protein